MAESKGWWYDRRKKIYIPIEDHATAASDNPQKYRVDPGTELAKLCAVYRLHTGLRDRIIPGICSRGFIRVRLIKGHSVNTLGWQFTGEPHDAFATLKRFASRHGVGPLVETTFTDFGLGRTLTTFWGDFDPEKPPLKTFLEFWEFTHAPRKWTAKAKKAVKPK
jgi:hypothetical protein